MGQVGQVSKGWRAIVGVTFIGGLVLLGYWLKSMPQNIDQGTWEIEPDHVIFYEIKAYNANRGARFKVECIPQNGSNERYAVFVIDEINKRSLSVALNRTNSMPDPKIWGKIAEVDGTGTLTLPDVFVISGTWFVVAENLSDHKITLKYRVVQLH